MRPWRTGTRSGSRVVFCASSNAIGSARSARRRPIRRRRTGRALGAPPSLAPAVGDGLCGAHADSFSVATGDRRCVQCTVLDQSYTTAVRNTMSCTDRLRRLIAIHTRLKTADDHTRRRTEGRAPEPHRSAVAAHDPQPEEVLADAPAGRVPRRASGRRSPRSGKGFRSPGCRGAAASVSHRRRDTAPLRTRPGGRRAAR